MDRLDIVSAMTKAQFAAKKQANERFVGHMTTEDERIFAAFAEWFAKTDNHELVHEIIESIQNV